MRIFNAKQSAHALQASSTTIFIILSLAAYIFVTFTLWFLREEDWVKRVIGSWKLADQDQGSRFPDLLPEEGAGDVLMRTLCVWIYDSDFTDI
jgi:hypothetical protein